MSYYCSARRTWAGVFQDGAAPPLSSMMSLWAPVPWLEPITRRRLVRLACWLLVFCSGRPGVGADNLVRCNRLVVVGKKGGHS